MLYRGQLFVRPNLQTSLPRLTSHLTVNPHVRSIWTAADKMADAFLARLPSLGLGLIVFFLFFLRRQTSIHFKDSVRVRLY